MFCPLHCNLSCFEFEHFLKWIKTNSFWYWLIEKQGEGEKRRDWVWDSQWDGGKRNKRLFCSVQRRLVSGGPWQLSGGGRQWFSARWSPSAPRCAVISVTKSQRPTTPPPPPPWCPGLTTLACLSAKMSRRQISGGASQDGMKTTLRSSQQGSSRAASTPAPSLKPVCFLLFWLKKKMNKMENIFQSGSRAFAGQRTNCSCQRLTEFSHSSKSNMANKRDRSVRQSLLSPACRNMGFSFDLDVFFFNGINS